MVKEFLKLLHIYILTIESFFDSQSLCFYTIIVLYDIKNIVHAIFLAVLYYYLQIFFQYICSDVVYAKIMTSMSQVLPDSNYRITLSVGSILISETIMYEKSMYPRINEI